MLLPALAIAPGLAISLFIFFRFYRREPAVNMVMSFVLGMATTVPASFVEHALDPHIEKNVAGILFSAFLGIALVEEACKFLVVRFYCYTRKSFNEPLDGIVYGVLVAMGFATVENFYYVTQHGLTVAFLRMFTSVPGHATFGVLMGYYVGKAKLTPQNRVRLLLTGLAAATLAHGIYDSFLLLSENHWITRYVSDLLLVAGALFSLFICIRLSRRLIRLHSITSHRFNKTTPMLTIREAGFEDISTIRDLSWRIWPQTYEGINSPPQIEYMMELLYSEEALRRQMEQGHKFLLVFNAGLPIGFAAYSEEAPGLFKLHKLYMLHSQQGRGAGKTVLNHIIEDIRAKGALALRLNVNRNNSAKFFYQKLGFEIIGEEDVDIGEGYFMWDYVMEKKL